MNIGKKDHCCESVNFDLDVHVEDQTYVAVAGIR